MSSIKSFGGIKELVDAFGALETIPVVLADTFSGITKALSTIPAAFSAASSATGGFAASASALFTTLSPLVTVFAALAGVAAVVSTFDALTTSFSELQEKSESARSAYESTKSELESVNSELSTTQSRISELQAKGSLTFVEEAELAKLQSTNEALLAQQKILQKMEGVQQEEAASAANDVLTKKQSWSNGEYEFQDNGAYTEKIYYGDLIDKAKSESDYVEELQKEYNDLQKKISNYAEEDMVSNTGLDWLLHGESDWDADNQQLESLQEQIETAQSNYADTISDINVEFASLFDEDGNVIEGCEETVERINDLLTDNYDLTASAQEKQEKLESVISNNDSFEKAKEDLVDIAEGTNNVGISVDKVKNKYPELAQAIEDAGFTVEDLTDYINSEAGILNLGNIADQLKENFKENIQDPLTESASETGETVSDELNSSLEEQNFNDWIDSLSDEDLLLVYQIESEFDTSDWDLDEYKSQLAAMKESVEESTSFETIFSEKLTEPIDTLQSELSSLNDAAESLDLGEDLDVTDLCQEFPELIGQTEDLQSAIGNLKADKVMSFVDSYKEAISGITDSDELAKAQSFFADFINGLDLSGVDMSQIETQIRNALTDSLGTDNWVSGHADEIIAELSSEIKSKEDLEIAFKFVADESNLTGNTDIAAAFENFKNSLNTTDLTDMVNTAIQAQSDMYSALSSSASATGLTTDEIDSLTSAYKNLDSFDAQKLFENTAQGVLVNKDALEELQQELNANTEAELYDQLIQKQMELREASAAGLDTSGIQSEIDSVNQLISQFEGTTSAYQKFVNAQSGSNQRDSLEGVASSYEDMENLVNDGWYGDESLNAYLDLLLSAEQRTGDVETDFAKLSQTIEGTNHSLKDYFTFDDDGDFTEEGIENFLQDVNTTLGEGYAKLDENNKWVFDATGDNLQDIADRFGTTTDMVELFIKAMQDAGMNVDWDDSTGIDSYTESVEKAKNAVQELQDSGEISSDIDLNFDTAEMSLTDIQSKITELKGERAEVDVEANPEGAAALDELISKCEEEYYVRLNMETDGGLDSAVSIVSQIESIIGQAQSEMPGITVKAAVEGNEQISTLATELAELPPEVQTAVGVSTENISDAQAIINQLTSAPSTINIPVNYDSSTVTEAQNSSVDDKNFSILADSSDADSKINKVNSAKIDDKKFSISASDNSTGVLSSIRNQIAGINSKTVTITTVHRSVSSSSGTSGANGTAHVAGTTPRIFGSAFNDGFVGHAYDSGNWGLRRDENGALTGELGAEILVRDGRFMTIGDNGAELVDLKKGDIIFNHRQSEDILSKGYTTGRGKLIGGTSHADGTISGAAFSGATATGKTKKWGSSSSSSSTSSSGSSSGSSSSGSSSSSSSKKSSSKKKSSKKSSSDDKETVDYIEIAVDRAERAIEKLKNAAENVFNSFSKRSKSLTKEISKVTDEISLQEKAYTRYMKEADSVDLSASIKKKVRNGSISIKDYSSDTQEKIKEYQEWYDMPLCLVTGEGIPFNCW